MKPLVPLATLHFYPTPRIKLAITYQYPISKQFVRSICTYNIIIPVIIIIRIDFNFRLFYILCKRVIVLIYIYTFYQSIELGNWTKFIKVARERGFDAINQDAEWWGSVFLWQRIGTGRLGFRVTGNFVPLSRRECTRGTEVRRLRESTTTRTSTRKRARGRVGRVNGKANRDVAGKAYVDPFA